MFKKIILPLFIIAFISCKQTEKKETDSEVKVENEEKVIKVVREEIIYETDSLKMKGYIAYDENKEEKVPGILIIHEWWGHNDYVRKRAEMLAELGYVAFAIDMYGDGKQASHPDDAGKFAMNVMKNIDVAKARFNAALTTLKNNPHVYSEKVAAIGYCFGGSVALTMANTGADLNAVAAFHSGVELPVMPNNDLKAAVLVCNGAADPFVSPESVAAYTKAMDSIKAEYKYVAYEDALHAFTSKDADSLGKKFDLPLAYNQEADEKSWEELKRFLNEAFYNYKSN
ncbi:dienelactone hydrolase family protein [Abyssalbus ytuae]|uniref:Dienelactone hydrolase family protein n=1 Tax=Abyssalbus ytuae TaxID=2926907 RepID=A0A9E6ZTC8_9FLAO|nr:dienelactone hydrolase family protein [Abyssalbus ytuae]UOB17458.1 dienelactone hydrolase family protein [Abyssalbus ytuae]